MENFYLNNQATRQENSTNCHKFKKLFLNLDRATKSSINKSESVQLFHPGYRNLFLPCAFLLCICFSFLSINISIAQSTFIVPIDAGRRIVPQFETRKVWIEVFNENNHQGEDFEIEIESFGLQMIDYSDYGYSVTDVLDDNDDISSRIFRKVISIPYGETRTEVAFFHRGTGIHPWSNSQRGVIIKILDMDSNQYLDPVYPVHATVPNEVFLKTQQPYDFYGNKIIDVSTTGEGTNLYDAFPDPSIYPHPSGGSHQWFLEGKIVLDGVAPFSNYTQFIFTNYTFDSDLIGDITRLSNITLMDETSSLVIRSPIPGDISLDATGVIVQSGDSGMGNGIIVEPGAVCYLRSSIIQDQHVGVTLIGDAVLYLEDTYFVDNVVSINVQPDPNSTSSGPAYIIMKNTHFSGTGNIKDRSLGRMYPHSHISISEGATVEIEIEQGEKVYMYNAEYGIYSKNAQDVVILGEGEIDFSKSHFNSLSQSNFEHFGFMNFNEPSNPPQGLKLYSAPIKGVGIYAENENNTNYDFNVNSVVPEVWKIIEPIIGVLVNNSNFAGREIFVENAEESGIEITGCEERNIVVKESHIESAPVAMKIHLNSESEILLEDNYSFTDLGIDISSNLNSEVFVNSGEIYAPEGIHIISNNASRIHIHDNYAETDDAGIKVLNNLASQITIDENEIYCDKDNITSIMNRMSAVLIEDNILWARKIEGVSADNTHGIYISERSLANPFVEEIYDPFSLPLGTYRVKANDIRMRGAQYGINAVNCRLVNIIDNEITMATLEPSEPIVNSYGILVQGGEYNYLSCNSMLSIDQYSKDNTAIYLANTLNTNVSNNYTSWLKTGLHIIGNNLDADIRTNVFYKHVNGLEYGIPTVMALTGPQEYRGNQWLDNAGGSSYYDAILHVDNLAIENRYVVNETHEPLCMPGIIQPSSGWFRDLSEMNNLLLYPDCLVEEEPVLTPEEEFYHENFYTITNSSIDLGPYGEEIRQDHYRYLYRGLDLSGRPYPASSSQVETGLIARGLNADLADAQIAMEAYVFGDSTGLNVSGLASVINGVTLPSGATNQEIALLKTMQALRYQLIGDTANYNTILPALTLAAEACPLEYGEAVYWARMILGPDHQVDYTDYAGCNRAPLLKREDPQGVRGFHAYPVPSSGLIMVDLPSESEELHVLDVQGQIIQSLQVSEMEKVELNIKGQGMYFISVKDKKGEIYTQKVIILN